MPDLMSSTALSGDDDDGVNAFLASLTGAENEPKRKAEDAATETEGEGTDDTHEETSGDAETTTESDETEAEADPDDAEVEIKVGEETKKATIKDLKRLYGQEASLTQKSQKVAEAQKAAETRYGQAHTALEAMEQRAREAYAPYASLDFIAVAQQMAPEDFQALRADAAAAEANVKFFGEELGKLQQANSTRQQQAHQEAAQATIKELSDPEKGIKGWGPELYNDLMTFAEGQGVQNARMATSAPLLRLLNMAMQWEKADGARKVAEGKVQAAPNKPTKVLKPGQKTSGGKAQTAMAQLRKTGSIDDAANAFLASF